MFRDMSVGKLHISKQLWGFTLDRKVVTSLLPWYVLCCV
jgi:hypothetical protein